ncbi:MAG: glycosyltransferase family 2 protein [Oscillospiraceae bacterium]|nr:glycosyltransferase family 2 protein [Oscillospiraceae bacterium]
MSSPIVSVILPCYNAEKYLCQCLDSILGQTLRDLEVICVDDGSTDGTEALLRRYAAADGRIRIVNQSNAGAGAARNTGLKLARGEYLSFLDADDFFEPDMLEKAVAQAGETEADYVVFQSDRYYQDQDAFGSMDWAVCLADIPPYQPFTFRELTGNVFLTFVGWAWDKLYRRSFVEAHGLYFQEQRTTNDMLFVFSALICARRIGLVRQVLAHQRRGNRDSLSVTREKSWHCFYDALTALKQRLEDEGLYRELEQDYVSYALHFSLWHLNTLAEPTRTLLEEKLRGSWFAQLGIVQKPESYFENHNEYAQFRRIYGTCSTPKDAVPQIAALPLPETVPFDSGEALWSLWARLDALRSRLMSQPQVWDSCCGAYWNHKLDHYRKILPRLDQGQAALLRDRMARELTRARHLGQLRQADFPPESWKEIQSLIAGLKGPLGAFTALPLVRRLSHCIPMPVKQAIVKILRTARKAAGRK